MGVSEPTISRAINVDTGDIVWTLRIPHKATVDVYQYAELRCRMAAWILKLAARAIEELS